jgi:branched-chain amino acid transport system permease protein
VIDTRENRWRLALGVFAVLFLFAAPQVFQLFTIINLTTCLALAILALSLGLVWGYGGILCFGQTMFFGLGAYTYTIAAINFGETTGAVLLAILVAAAFAAVLG